MQNILVTGANGQLGNEMQVIAKKHPALNFFFTDVAELDITNKEAIETYLKANSIDGIVNCAAYTAVDKAEDDVELCYLINKTAAQYIGEAANSVGAKVIHVSTDYVFDGKSYLPYTEDMPICPQSAYGQSKAEGEMALLHANPNSVVIRTSWLYSSFGNNFVKTMIKLGTERDTLNVIFDQVGTPTYAADLASAIMSVINHSTFTPGIYHFSNEGVCSWYDFTITIHKLSNISCMVSPIESKDYPAKAPRPHYSVLNKAKLKSTYNITIPHWVDGLERCLEMIKGA